jgi:hypothetical protein
MYFASGARAIEPSEQIRRTGIQGRAKVKQVFDYQQCAHVWAQQSQEHGRSPKGQMYFHGATIYSYGSHYPIARFTDATLDGSRVVLFNSEKNSTTTERHRDNVRAALRGLDVFTFNVPRVVPQWSNDESMHRDNVAHLVAAFDSTATRAAKPHVKFSWIDSDNTEAARIDALASPAAHALNYCRAFGIEAPALDIEAAASRIRAAFVRYNDPKRVAKRAASETAKLSKHWRVAAHVCAYFEGVTDKVPSLHFVPHNAKEAVAKAFNLNSWQLQNRIDAVQAERRAAMLPRSERIISAEQWANHEPGNLGRAAFYSEAGTKVRRVGDTLETSRGAECPFKHAIIAFLKAQECRATGTSWHRNGQQIRVGHFQVDSIDEYGNMRAGCHTLEYGEMQRLAIKEVPHLVKACFGLPVVSRV